MRWKIEWKHGLNGRFNRESREVNSSQFSQLPIIEVLDSLRAAFASRDEVVLQAPPGAGKTTMVPLALLKESWLGSQKILLLEPRRVAARAAAMRMAQMLGEEVGDTIGYRIRQDHCVSANTRIEVITEGILTRLLQSDPSLAGTGLVIFDEFHERNLNSDLCRDGRYFAMSRHSGCSSCPPRSMENLSRICWAMHQS